MWSKDLILDLIIKYKEHANLYDFRHPMYLDSEKRTNSLFQICKELQKVNSDITEDDVKKEIRTLRTEFVRELRILEKRKGSGFDGEVSEPKLWCFKELEFLSPFSNPKSFVSSESEVNDSSSASTCEEDKSTSDSSIKSQEANPDVLDAFQENGNDLSVLGWSSQYAALSSEQKSFARNIIADVFHGCLDNISEDLVREIFNVLESNA